VDGDAAFRRSAGGPLLRPPHGMDVFDPSVATGVCAPSWGGIGAAAGLRLLRGLAGLQLAAAEVNNVNPIRAIEGLTASLAATIAFELRFARPRPEA